MSETRNPSSAALFLSGRVGVIAAREDAGQCFNEVKKAVDDIERMINRPIPPMFLGPCPVVITDARARRACGTALTAARKDVEVRCPACDTTHNVERLIIQQIDDTDDLSF